jgi:hypothetical protein
MNATRCFLTVSLLQPILQQVIAIPLPVHSICVLVPFRLHTFYYSRNIGMNTALRFSWQLSVAGHNRIHE